MAILHRPLFPGTCPEDTVHHPLTRAVSLHRESIWISYCPMAMKNSEPYHLCRFESHHRVATPVMPWERLKIGGGTPPIMTRLGWLVVYHGVCEYPADSRVEGRRLSYSAGVMVLSGDHPRHILYRSHEPVLSPELPEELQGDAPTSSSPRASTAAPISARRIDSTSITAWPTTGSACVSPRPAGFPPAGAPADHPDAEV